MERDIFGENSFFQYVLGNNERKETNKIMLKKVKHHGAVQKSLGCATMTGMVDPYYKVKADLHEDEGGEQESPWRYYFCNICFKTRAGD